MSIHLVDEVWHRETGGHPERIILLALADFADDDGSHLFPSQARLAWKTDYSERQVRRILASLLERGVLELVKKGRSGVATEYRLHVEQLAPKARFNAEPDKVSGSPSRTPETVLPDIPSVLPDIAMADHPSSEPSVPVKTAKATKRNPLHDALAEVEGSDPQELTRAAGRAIGVALADIRKVSPNVTAEEIKARAQQYRRLHPDWDLTAPALAKHWPKLGRPARVEEGVWGREPAV